MKFSQIDDLKRSEHSYLAQTDQCIYLREYTARMGYSHSETNQLVLNLKKSTDRRGKAEYRYKEKAIAQCATEIFEGLNPEWLKTATIVPVPPSKAKTDPLYDDRMVKVANEIARLAKVKHGIKVDVRELVIQRESADASHGSENRKTPTELFDNYDIDESIAKPPPSTIGVLDDVLTTGSHFKAMQRKLRERFGNVVGVGIFVARRDLGSTPAAADDYDDEDLDDDYWLEQRR